MKTIHVDDEDALTVAAAWLHRGEVIVVPTDTVYGLAALPDNAGAVRTIYRAKGRPDDQHLPVLASSLEQVLQLGVDIPVAARTLAARWWPGPLTMALGFAATAGRPPWLSGREEVAVRIPQNDFLLALMERTGVLLVTSANRHGETTPASATAAGFLLAPHVRLVVDAGALDASPSTLVNVRSSAPAVEREGAIGREAIAAEWARSA